MNTETYITAICLIAAAAITTISFRLAHWRNRAERAEAAMNRVEAEITATPEKSLYQRLREQRNAWLATVDAPNDLCMDDLGSSRSLLRMGDPISVFLNGERVKGATAYNIAEGWVRGYKSNSVTQELLHGTVSVKLGEVS